MKWNKALGLSIHQLWEDHNKVIMYAGFFVLLGIWLNPLIQQASYKNQCIHFATKEFLARASIETKSLTELELARTEAYRFCNHI